MIDMIGLSCVALSFPAHYRVLSLSGGSQLFGSLAFASRMIDRLGDDYRLSISTQHCYSSISDLMT